MLKSELRKLALEKRKALSEAELRSLSQKLLSGFKTLEFSGVNSVHIFLPIVHQKEPDTFLIIDWLTSTHPQIQIIVPKADFQSNQMSNYSFAGKADLLNNAYHIPEPQKAKPFTGTPDMVILPLLAFDQNGYRVGYGKGFYDRFLQGKKTQKIGLSLFDSVSAINDVHLNDVRLDKCITPNQIIDFDHV